MAGLAVGWVEMKRSPALLEELLLMSSVAAGKSSSPPVFPTAPCTFSSLVLAW